MLTDSVGMKFAAGFAAILIHSRESIMRVQDNGALFTVCVSKSDVLEFASRWPCYGPRRALWFQFDKASGDLVDMHGDSQRNDGAGILALSADAYEFGRDKVGSLICFPPS